MATLPVIALRLLDGRVGSTLLMRLLATSDHVVIEPGYAEGERRYLSYCLRIAQTIATPWDAAQHPDATSLFFGPVDRTGPIPFDCSLVDPRQLAPQVLSCIWEAFSEELCRSVPAGQYYAEKLVGESRLLLDSDIPVHLIDVVRDPRDVFCSIRSFSPGRDRLGRHADDSDEHALEQMVTRHRAQLELMADTAGDVRRILIRYEDLVTNLTSTADVLNEWLGLQLDADLLRVVSDQDRAHMTSRTPAESVGRWQRELAQPLAKSLWSELGQLLEPMGYTPS